jgi:hypothetical protein
MPIIEGIAQFGYTRTLPGDAIAIASVSSTLTKPSDLVDVTNTTYLPASLGIWKYSTDDADPADFTCPDYYQSVVISGVAEYKVYNQFFQLTNQVDSNGNILWYMHQISASPGPVTLGFVKIIDLSGNLITDFYNVVGNIIYHNLADKPYLVQYTDLHGYIHTNLLQSGPAIAPNQYSTEYNCYTLIGRTLQVSSTSNYYIRFTQPDGFLAVDPWTSQPNTPWYMRIRFALTPFPTEYATQLFAPVLPYMLATYVPGTVYPQNIVGFERPNIYTGGQQPNILVFNSDYSIKYAIDGSAPGTPSTLGNQYNWQKGLIYDMDPYNAFVKLSVDIDPTDIVYGFYSYKEPDYIFTAIDVNPITNPVVQNRYVQFYAKTGGSNPLTNIFYQVIDPVTGPVSGATNDPGGGTKHIFSTISVGGDISPSTFTITDARVRGGGLSPKYQDDPSSYSCWDLGFWDSAPYPVAGAIVVYAPATLLNTLTRAVVQASIQAVLPAGVFPCVRYYSNSSPYIEEV